ncbi:membrane protein [Campylobacterota bacterium]|nr:membrane protein [Campylobacterota bacterium]
MYRLARFGLLLILLVSSALGVTVDPSVESELAEVREQIKRQNQRIGAGNAWITLYQDQKDYLALQAEKAQIEREMKTLAPKRDNASRQQLALLEERSLILQTRLTLLGEGGSPHEAYARVEPIEEPGEVRNPFAIVYALTYLHDTGRQIKEHQNRLDVLKQTIAIEQELFALYERQIALESVLGQQLSFGALNDTHMLIAALGNTAEVFTTALSVQEKRFAAFEEKTRSQIENELVNLVTIVIAITVILALGFLIKLIIRRTVSDTNRQFGIARAINIASFSLILFILLFNYINNIGYFVTVLGFISAGIAIAMKDWFMSLLGWSVIVFGGSMHVGDRIRVVLDGEVVVADVLEIGLTRVMLFEDVTLATFDQNRRAGRIIHIPNNYIFTHMIQNYTYNEMQTVWDGIDIVITFDSNHKKAQKLAKEIATKHAIGYTDLTRKHYANLRAGYNMRAVGVEPRVFTFACPYGMKVSIWYLTNSYATLSLRSVICQEVIEAFSNTENIKIAYPTYAVGAADERRFAPPIDIKTASLFETS